jgi:serine/threonine protein kinase
MYRTELMPVWSSLDHEHISPLLAIHTNDHSLPALEVPFYKEGNILDHNKRCPDVDKFEQIKQMAAGISYLHGQNVSHGNICPVRSFIHLMVRYLIIFPDKRFD